MEPWSGCFSPPLFQVDEDILKSYLSEVRNVNFPYYITLLLQHFRGSKYYQLQWDTKLQVLDVPVCPYDSDFFFNSEF